MAAILVTVAETKQAVEERARERYQQRSRQKTATSTAETADINVCSKTRHPGRHSRHQSSAVALAAFALERKAPWIGASLQGSLHPQTKACITLLLDNHLRHQVVVNAAGKYSRASNNQSDGFRSGKTYFKL